MYCPKCGFTIVGNIECPRCETLIDGGTKKNKIAIVVLAAFMGIASALVLHMHRNSFLASTLVSNVSLNTKNISGTDNKSTPKNKALIKEVTE